jgi:hypothetical protein
MLIEYVHKMGNEDKPLRTYEEEEIPGKIIEIIRTNDAFTEPKTFGKKGIGSPDEIEQLNIIAEDGSRKEFSYFNKSIHYAFAGGEKERPIFQVFAHFMKEQRSKRS